MKSVYRLGLTSIVVLSLCGPALAQDPRSGTEPPVNTPAPAVTFGVLSFLQYSAELHEEDGFNAFDVTRGYFDIHARLSDRVRVRFTPNVRPTTDAVRSSATVASCFFERKGRACLISD